MINYNHKKILTQHSCSQMIDCNYVFISEPCIDYYQADWLIKQNLRKYKINRELYNIKLEDAKKLSTVSYLMLIIHLINAHFLIIDHLMMSH